MLMLHSILFEVVLYVNYLIDKSTNIYIFLIIFYESKLKIGKTT